NGFGCYKVRCPKAALPTLQLNDQFGSRAVTPRAAKILCAPAPAPTTTSTTTTTTSSCPPATAFYCGGVGCGVGGAPSCENFALCPQGMTCDQTMCSCTGPAVPCGPSLGGLTCNLCRYGSCPAGMACVGIPRVGACGYDCGSQRSSGRPRLPLHRGPRNAAEKGCCLRPRARCMATIRKLLARSPAVTAKPCD